MSTTTSTVTSTYTVTGMTCGHCVSSVQGEVGKVDGVTSVDVDLASGRVTVSADGAVDDAAVVAAVAEAGYEVVEETKGQSDGPSCCGSCH
ncbi:MAG: heavy-metal-associated domain-containing protein [Streptomycetaceae bacterium]|nr:heavy-metal-associated domain-containing protein [Streptomycetaceae bacterium]